jgi:protein-tyrosine phosphatase
MIDIHSHILPSVDDGAEDIEESIAMARIYLKNEIKKVIATPHYIEGYENSTKENNLLALEKLKEALDKEGLDLKIYLGNEIYISMDIASLLKEGKVSTLNDSRYVLVELPMIDMPMYTESVIYELLLKGYIPIIAHPERNSSIMADPNILYELISKGALAQLNLPSLEGKYGEEIKATAEILLKHNMIHFVGTDAHSKDRRAPNVKNSLDLLLELVGETAFIEITYLNPLKVISDELISPNAPVRYKKKSGFLHFIKNKVKFHKNV